MSLLHFYVYTPSVNMRSDKVSLCLYIYIGLPISGIEDDAGVELDSSFSSRKNARNRFIPGHGQNAAPYITSTKQRFLYCIIYCIMCSYIHKLVVTVERHCVIAEMISGALSLFRLLTGTHKSETVGGEVFVYLIPCL